MTTRTRTLSLLLSIAAAAAGCDTGESGSPDPAIDTGAAGKQDGFGETESNPGYALRSDLPALYDVVGVDEGDVLNVRALPSASAAILGELAYDASEVEVVAIDGSGGWAQVNIGERAGWASVSYLEKLDDVWEGQDLPRSLSCIGTEPFWGLDVDAGTLRISTPDGADEFAISEVLVPAGFSSAAPMRTVLADREGQSATVSILPGLCSDSASEMLYGLGVNVVLREDGSTTSLGGCCSIAP